MTAIEQTRSFGETNVPGAAGVGGGVIAAGGAIVGLAAGWIGAEIFDSTAFAMALAGAGVVSAAAVGRFVSKRAAPVDAGGSGDRAEPIDEVVLRAVNATNTPIMIADDAFTIQYVNPALAKSLHKSASSFKHVDLKDPAAFVGKSIDVFHRASGPIRERLSALKGEMTTKIGFDDRSFQLDVSRIDGGFVVEWREVTDSDTLERELSRVIKAISEGRLDERVRLAPDATFGQEAASGVNHICELVDKFIGELETTVGAFAKGDVSQQITEPFEGRFGEVASALNHSMRRIARLATEIVDTGAAVRVAIGEITDGAGDLATRADAQASNLEETVSSVDQMSAQIKASADLAQSATHQTARSQESARAGSETVRDAVTAMERIEQSSTKISDIVTMIDSIAFQTNLLALNAAVEAARAGEAGKGFAVVAQEVRTLAQRSADAARDISSLIAESRSHVDDGVERVRSAGSVLEDIVTAISETSDTVGRISASSSDQAVSAEQIVVVLRDLDLITQKNASMAEQSAASAKLLHDRIDVMNELVSYFKVGKSAAIEFNDATPAKATTAAAAPARKPVSKAAAARVEAAEAASDASWTKASNAPAPSTSSRRSGAGAPAAQPAAAKPSAAASAPSPKRAEAPSPKPMPAEPNFAPNKADGEWAEF